ncbi:MAG: hypothetical protein GXP62_12975, partial [Oligoflexia bacterium]|nr:hypothetical protein [Oligoflexia bacterium]
MTEPRKPTPRGADSSLSMPVLALCSLVLVLAIYGQSLGYGHVQDDALLLGGDRVAKLTTLPNALSRDLFWLAGDQIRTSPYWRPVTVASYYVDQLWSGGASWAGHLTNMLLLTGLGVVVGRQARSTSV